jgi:hypothetical protein
MNSDSGVVIRTCGGRRVIACRCADAGQRRPEILLDVVVQRAKRRDVDDVDTILELALEPESTEVIESPQERRQGLAGAGRRDNERVTAGGDRVPALTLSPGGFSERLTEPAADEGEEVGGHPLEFTP